MFILHYFDVSGFLEVASHIVASVRHFGNTRSSGLAQ